MAISRTFLYQRRIAGESPFGNQETNTAMIAAYGEAMLDGFAKVHPTVNRNTLRLGLDDTETCFMVYEDILPVASMIERAFLLYALEGLLDDNTTPISEPPLDIWTVTTKITNIKLVLAGVEPMTILTVEGGDGYDRISVLPKMWREKKGFLALAFDNGQKIQICAQKEPQYDRQRWVATAIESVTPSNSGDKKDEEKHCPECDTELEISKTSGFLYCPNCSSETMSNDF